MQQLILLQVLAVLSFSVFAQDAAIQYKPVEVPAGFSSQLNVVYTKAGDWEGKMDLYLPPKTGKPTLIVINIHGGGWNKGVKESQTGFNSFFKNGFAVANIAYRLTGQATAPAAVEDIRCALAFLIKNANALNIDVNKIVIMGGSAGGHLALMGGLLGNDQQFNTNCRDVENVKVAAIINKYGIADLWDGGNSPVSRSKSVNAWLGTKARDKKFIVSVSPITYINKNSPPVFIVHGDADPIVPYQQSIDLHKKLTEAGVITKFITVEGGLHGKFDKEKNTEIIKEIIAFLKMVKVIE